MFTFRGTYLESMFTFLWIDTSPKMKRQRALNENRLNERGWRSPDFVRTCEWLQWRVSMQWLQRSLSIQWLHAVSPCTAGIAIRTLPWVCLVETVYELANHLVWVYWCMWVWNLHCGDASTPEHIQVPLRREPFFRTQMCVTRSDNRFDEFTRWIIQKQATRE